MTIIDNAVLVGEGRPYVVALVAPSFEELERWAETNGVDWTDHEHLAGHPKVLEGIEKAVAEVDRSNHGARPALEPPGTTMRSGKSAA